MIRLKYGHQLVFVFIFFFAGLGNIQSIFFCFSRDESFFSSVRCFLYLYEVLVASFLRTFYIPRGRFCILIFATMNYHHTVNDYI